MGTLCVKAHYFFLHLCVVTVKAQSDQFWFSILSTHYVSFTTIILRTSLVKGKAVPIHSYAGALEVRRYSSYSSVNSAPDGGEWSASRLAALYLRKGTLRYPLDRRLGGPQTQGLEEKSFASAGNRTLMARSYGP
jgi:hypothetical protein